MGRSGVIQFRVSVEERARIEALAGAAGVALSVFVRGRALGVEQASVGEARGGAVDAARSRPVPRPSPAAPAELPSALRRFRCPVHDCGFAAGSGKAVCPVHGRPVVAA